MILSVIEGEILSPKFIERLVETAFVNPEYDRAAIEAERERIAREVENLTKAVAVGGEDIPSIVKMLKDRDKRLRVLDAKLSAEPPDRAKLREALEQRRQDWRAILRSNVAQARVVLQQLIALPLVVEAEPVPSYIKEGDHRGWEWLAKARPYGLLVGLTPTVHDVVSPGGVEPPFSP